MTEANEGSAKQLMVIDLINLLENFDPGLPVWIMTSDDTERCYERLLPSDIEKGDIWIPEAENCDGTSVEDPGIIIGRRFFS